MDNDALTNILNLLQNNSETKTDNNNGLDLQNLLLKFLLSGGLTKLMEQKPVSPETPPTDLPRTINLENYQRLD